MPKIETGTGIVTQINVFTVPEGGQDALIDLLLEAAEACREVDGWISASLHRSLDGKRVVNYAQARDREAMGRVFQVLTERGFLKRNEALGQASPGLYEVLHTLDA